MAVHVKGHPIHTMLVVFPVGLWFFSLVFDVIFFATGNVSFYRAAYYNLLFGILAAVPTAIFGLLDFTQIRDPHARQTGVVHMVVNLVGTFFFLLSLLVRSVFAPGPTILAEPVHGLAWIMSFVLSLVALAFITIGGWKGGDLVYRHRVGVGLEPPPLNKERRSGLDSTEGHSGYPGEAAYGA